MYRFERDYVFVTGTLNPCIGLLEIRRVFVASFAHCVLLLHQAGQFNLPIITSHNHEWTLTTMDPIRKCDPENDVLTSIFRLQSFSPLHSTQNVWGGSGFVHIFDSTLSCLVFIARMEIPAKNLVEKLY